MADCTNVKIGDKLFRHSCRWGATKSLVTITVETPKQIGYKINNHNSMFWKKNGRAVGGGGILEIPTQQEIDSFLIRIKIANTVNDISNKLATIKNFNKDDLPVLKQFNKFLEGR